MANKNVPNSDFLDDALKMLEHEDALKVFSEDDFEDSLLYNDTTDDTYAGENPYSVNKKVKTKMNLVEDNVLLSVRNLKQFFYFGKGPNRTKLKAVNNVSFDVHNGDISG